MPARVLLSQILYGFTAISIFLLTGCEAGPPTSVATSQDNYSIRVLLYDKITSASLMIDCPYRILSVDTTEAFSAQKTEEKIEVKIQTDGIKLGWQVFKTKRLVLEPQDGKPFIVNDRSYRGSIEFIANEDNNSLMVINIVPLEIYLMGVVSAEMPSYWEQEALKAQAIAARTYCLYIKSRFGKNRNWDIKATQANQVYKGIIAETIRTNNAINATRGMVLCCEHPTGTCEIFPAYYSSICGGHTENAQDVFGESCPALVGVDCPYCRQITKPELFYWPMAQFDKKYITERITERYPELKDLGQIEKIEVARENVYDSTILQEGLLPRTSKFRRIVAVRLIGSTGKTATLRAEDLRLAIDLTGTKIQSTSCIIINLEKEILFVAGTGFGHGVGLCQYGARQMAREGKDYQEILKFYYPNSRIKILY